MNEFVNEDFPAFVESWACVFQTPKGQKSPPAPFILPSVTSDKAVVEEEDFLFTCVP